MHFFPQTAQKHQVFTDFIIETLAETGTNKTGELHLFYAVLLLSVFLFFVLYTAADSLFIKHASGSADRSDGSPRIASGAPRTGSMCGQLFLLTFLPNVCGFILYRNISYPLLFLSLLSVIGWFLFRDNVLSVAMLFLFAYYGSTAVFTLLCRLGLVGTVRSSQLYLTALVAAGSFLVLFLITGRHALLQMPLLFLQLLFPGLLLVCFVDKYRYRSELLTIPYAKGYTCFFMLLFAAAYAILFVHIRNFLRRQDRLKQLKDVTYFPLSAVICKVTPILLYIYHSFSAAPMYAQPDQHHHGEQMIPWQQVITLGQSLYQEYTPVSGLFPFLSGAIQHVLLNGTVSDYSPAISISMVLFCILTMYLITEHAGTVWGVAFAVFFCLPCYNRQYFVLPVLLLLFLPKLLRKPNLWMKVWLLSCFIAGLYYPLFGGALVIGTLPLLIRQLTVFLRSEEWKKCRKSAGFYVNWFFCLLPVLASAGLLLRMLRHTLTYSSQTILADSISLWGQNPPDCFMTYVSNPEKRRILYLLLRFLLPVSGVAIFAFLLSYVLTNCRFKYRKQEADSSVHPLFFLLAGGLSLLVSYSYTLVRADTGMLLSRTSYILVAVAGMFLPVMLRSCCKAGHSGSQGSLKRKADGSFLPQPLALLLTAACFSLPMLLYHQTSDVKRPDMWIYPDGESALVLDDGAKIYDHYDVPDSFVRSYDSGLSEKQIATLGEGFIVADQLHYLTDYSMVMDKCEAVQPDTTYLGLDGQGFYYYLNAKACGTGFIQAAKGYEAQRALLSVIEKKRPVVFLLEPKSSYYIYYYIMTHDYLYLAEDQALYPRELYELLDAGVPDDYRTTCNSTDLGLVGASFGNSADTLLPLLTPMSFKDNDSDFIPFKGSDYDCLLVKLSNDAASCSTVCVHFTFREPVADTGRQSCSVTCRTNGDTLLIPMGMDCCWLLGTIEEITFTGMDDSGTEIELEPESVSYKLYKIR
ncbi:MAG: hypothetical protein IJ711_11450 [Lachnospiraceae bacterium]|nr:hypothetical protein [Lachnospiraceae bacterium]